jgi:exopolysaccharide biosynthesis protein
MSKNYIEESGESTKKELIDRKEVTKYKDEYERQILEHEEGQKYKVIKLQVDGQNGFLAAIYDPTSIKVEVTQELGSRGEYVTHMAQRNDALLAINGGGFMDPGGSSWGGTPTGITISNGKIITNNEYGRATETGGIIGFTEDGTLMLLKVNKAEEALKQGVINAVSWGPYLIVNGVTSKVNGNGGWGPGARSAIGQRRDGVVLMLVIDSNASRTKGATMADLAEIMERYGAVNAANLDGGTSSVMALPKEIAKSEWNAPCRDYFTNTHCAINDPIDSTGTHQTRFIATSFVVLDK